MKLIHLLGVCEKIRYIPLSLHLKQWPSSIHHRRMHSLCTPPLTPCTIFRTSWPPAPMFRRASTRTTSSPSAPARTRDRKAAARGPATKAARPDQHRPAASVGISASPTPRRASQAHAALPSSTKDKCRRCTRRRTTACSPCSYGTRTLGVSRPSSTSRPHTATSSGVLMRRSDSGVNN